MRAFFPHLDDRRNAEARKVGVERFDERLAELVPRTFRPTVRIANLTRLNGL